MGLIEQEIMELRKLCKDSLSGKIAPDQAAIQIGFYNQIAKRVSQIIQINAIESRAQKSKTLARMIGSNVIGDGVAISVDSVSSDYVVCKELGGECVTAEHCVDYSGDSLNIDKCQGCDNFEKTRRLVLK